MKTQKILLDHGISTKWVGNTLLALDEWTLNGVYDCKWIDVTNYTVKQIKNFLGY